MPLSASTPARLLVLCLLIVGSGCLVPVEMGAPDPHGIDGGALPDAGPTADASTVEDAGAFDAGEPGDISAFELKACIRIGGLDRVEVEIRELTRGTCTELILVSPAQRPGAGFDIAMPANWGVEQARFFPDGCEKRPGDKAGIRALGGKGNLTFDRADKHGFPQELSVHATLELEGANAGPVRLDATGEVRGTCPNG